MFDLKIRGTGRFIPQTVVTNDMMASIVETSDEWITTRTGISRRHLSSGEPTWYMGAQAALLAIEAADIDPLQIDLIVVTTTVPDYFTPSTACIIQAEVQATNAFCFDINAACSGFVYAMDLAGRYLSTPGINNILIVSTETISKFADYTDRATCVLFGDGAGAVVVSRANPGETSRLLSTVLAAEGHNAGYLVGTARGISHPFVKPEDVWPDRYDQPDSPYLYMAGQDVYKFAVRSITDSISQAADKAGIAVSEIDWIIPHQANARIVDAAIKRLKVDPSVMIQRMEEYGNTSSASIPICLDELVREGRLHRGDTVAVSGFGGGLTYGAAIFVY